MEDEKQEFILEEYRTATQLTFHIDSLRNKVTGFFLSFAGLISGLLFIVIESKQNELIINTGLTVFSTCSFVAVIGLIVTCITAKLRHVQLEHFLIINNIRDYFIDIEKDKKLRKTLVLNSGTLPNARFFSGTYFWGMLIILTSSTIFSIGMYFILDNILISVVVFIGYFIILNFVYFRLAVYPKKTFFQTLRRKFKKVNQ